MNAPTRPVIAVDLLDQIDIRVGAILHSADED